MNALATVLSTHRFVLRVLLEKDRTAELLLKAILTTKEILPAVLLFIKVNYLRYYNFVVACLYVACQVNLHLPG